MPKKRLLLPILPYILSLLLLLSAGCISNPGQAGPATATAQALRAQSMATQLARQLQATARVGNVHATATAQSVLYSLQSAAYWPLLLSDPFDENTYGWPDGEGTDPLADIHWSFAGGRYRWEAQARESFVWWAIPDMGTVSDFYLAASIQQVSGPADAECGLVFRLDGEGDGYYLFEINGQGQYAFFLQEAGTWEALIDWQESPAIYSGRPNRLAVIARGPSFFFFINGQAVTGWTDERLSQGGAGHLIGLAHAGDQGAWEFDDFELRSPDPGLPETAATPFP